MKVYWDLQTLECKFPRTFFGLESSEAGEGWGQRDHDHSSIRAEASQKRNGAQN